MPDKPKKSSKFSVSIGGNVQHAYRGDNQHITINDAQVVSESVEVEPVVTHLSESVEVIGRNARLFVNGKQVKRGNR